ncbi:cyclase family protein [Nocardioides sp. QY071]|uniref:cyclase family protein n=1 Tax=Nocardioides sp. QY071 TaxID=3044187 RepID=UPI00249AFADE|nr:cyclase family protein [Nocardioides sp. QY071]WGY00325.1 cyclase family protein [Nocardioides sp. QY071]
MTSLQHRRLSKEQVDALAQEHRRWGRWGEDDELGAMNFIEPATVRHAACLVRLGQVISCAMPYDATGPQTGYLGRFNPMHFMTQDGGDVELGAQDHLPGLRFADDVISMPLQSGTHWDAFSHIFYDGKMYNGFGLEHVTSAGARKGALETMREQLTGRGVLLDFPRFKGVDWLQPGDAIHGDDLLACAAAQGVTLGRGDILLIRTGHLRMCRAEGWGDYAGGDAPGLSLDTADVIVDAEIAAIASDTWGVEVRPNETEAVMQPLHVVLLVSAGVIFGEMFDLEKLADACAEDGVYEFLLVAPPVPFTGAVGGPLNPIAIR